jgi:GNAT superfamily N-acetyltransferase
VPSEPAELDVRPLTPERWPDLEDLFGPNGAIAGCWCMYWRTAGRDPYGSENRAAFHSRVSADPPPGLLAYADDRAVGWVQVGRREEFLRIERSRHLGPIDDVPVWSVNCFYIRRGYRKRGIARALLDEAIAFAAGHGAATLEAYPVDRPAAGTGEIYTGVPSMFAAAGFTEVARRHPSRPIMRRPLTPS